MQHFWNEIDGELEVSYKWKTKNNQNSMFVKVTNEQQKIEENSDIEFISEHYWGMQKRINIKRMSMK